MKEHLPLILTALRWVGFALAAVLWYLFIRKSLRGAARYGLCVSLTAANRARSFPEEELHPALRKKGGEPPRQPVYPTDGEGNPVSDPPTGFPDPEEEKQYPYYQRTGRIVCDVKRHDPNAIRSRSWYGYQEWMQDLICGQVDPVLFRESDPTNKGAIS